MIRSLILCPLPQVQMTRKDLVEGDHAQALGTKPDRELAGEAPVPRRVDEAPDIDRILTGSTIQYVGD